MVPDRGQQHSVIIQAVQNHTPEVLIVDEIGTAAEAYAIRTAAQRGVIVVATAHGDCLEQVVHNPEINSLIGGLMSSTMGDALARENGNSKIRTERRGVSAFGVVVEMTAPGAFRVHLNATQSVDALLSSGKDQGAGFCTGAPALSHLRVHNAADGTNEVKFESIDAAHLAVQFLSYGDIDAPSRAPSSGVTKEDATNAALDAIWEKQVAIADAAASGIRAVVLTKDDISNLLG